MELRRLFAYLGAMVAVWFIGTHLLGPQRSRKIIITEVVPKWRYRVKKTIFMEVTAYDNCPICCEKYFGQWKTATGRDSHFMDGVAADWRLLPPDTRLRIPIPERLRQAYSIDQKDLFRVVDDSGGAMREDANPRDNFGNPKPVIYHIDLRVQTHQFARVWGVQRVPVDILEVSEASSAEQVMDLIPRYFPGTVHAAPR